MRLLLLPDPVCALLLHPGQSSAGFQAPAVPGSDREPAKNTLNVITITSAPAQPAPELLLRPCAHLTWRRRAVKRGHVPAPVHALVSTELHIPRALLNPASAGWEGGRFLQSCHFYIWATLSGFTWAQGVL